MMGDDGDGDGDDDDDDDDEDDDDDDDDEDDDDDGGGGGGGGRGGGSPPFAWKITWCPWAAPGILAKARRLQLADASFRDKSRPKPASAKEPLYFRSFARL